ncbi:VOC family protein [Ruegeria sp. 2012CJ41-6]|uniref:VOC family protein n=1 Tax=Ruegeria spongiae TaxID=2942209 RepID=A0ABT0PZV8_9RHOB|nr:VOC family protein [Ruegeria spongiae]MCL6283166.1 VOC family protein [Ruegeria spongiae]
MRLDHLAVLGTTLEEAAEHVEASLGVALGPGGQHAKYGTHNRLMGLEGGLYLEAIAIEPGVAPQEHPRWMDLDRFSGPARLANWIIRSDDLEDELALLPMPSQRIVQLERGDLRWKMTVPKDGILPFGGMFPSVLQWMGRMPGGSFAPTGCTLRRLTIRHPQADDLRADLGRVLPDDRIAVETGPVGMVADFDTPSGRRVLE